jgi:hypothetical protein
VGEAAAVAVAQRGVVAQQVARHQLEVLEVERRTAPLGVGVAGAEALDDFAEQATARDLTRIAVVVGHRQPRLGLAAAAPARVELAHEAAQPVGPIGRDQLEPVGLGVVAQEVLHRLLGGLQRQARGLALVEHAVLGVDARGQRMGAQHA